MILGHVNVLREDWGGGAEGEGTRPSGRNGSGGGAGGRGRRQTEGGKGEGPQKQGEKVSCSSPFTRDRGSTVERPLAANERTPRASYQCQANEGNEAGQCWSQTAIL